jgi:hypothetical protein
MAKKAKARKAAATTARKAASRKSSAQKTARKTVRSTRKTAKTARKSAPTSRKAATPRRHASARLADVRGAEVRRDVGGVRLEAGRAGNGRVKRMIYPPGYKWSVHTKPYVDSDLCMHAHVGFLVQGRIDVVYADGCVEVFEAPQVVAVAPGHDGHVVGREPAVLIEFDFEGDTVSRFGMPEAHTHE